MLGSNLTDLISKTFSAISETILEVRVMIVLPCSRNIIYYHGTELLLGQTPVLHDECSSVGQLLGHSEPHSFVSKHSSV